jgi:hypothetical protein
MASDGFVAVNQVRHATEPPLLGEVLGGRTHKGVKALVARQFRLALNRGIAVLIGFRQIENVNEFG